jgi:hypothetical protein
VSRLANGTALLLCLLAVGSRAAEEAGVEHVAGLAGESEPGVDAATQQPTPPEEQTGIVLARHYVLAS